MSFFFLPLASSIRITDSTPFKLARERPSDSCLSPCERANEIETKLDDSTTFNKLQLTQQQLESPADSTFDLKCASNSLVKANSTLNFAFTEAVYLNRSIKDTFPKREQFPIN